MKTTGLLRISLQILILIYVIGFVIIKNKQYLEYEAPVGTTKPSLLKVPQHAHTDDHAVIYTKNSNITTLDQCYPLAQPQDAH